MSPESESESESNTSDDADGLEAAEEAIDEEPEPGLGPGAENGDEDDAGDSDESADDE